MSLILNDIVMEDISSIIENMSLSELAGKKVLITGANGHLASWLTAVLAETKARGIADVDITALSRNHEALFHTFGALEQRGLVTLIAGDVSEELPEEMDFDYIFHFAGNASPWFISRDPVGILRSNIEGTFKMAEICRRKQGSRLVFASTREVYGKNTEEDELKETSFGSLDPLDSRSCYPESKRAAESIIEAYHRQYGIRYTIVRIAHVYGPGMKLANDGRVMSDFLCNALRGEAIRLNSDGSALRSFCYITDAIRGLLLAALQPEVAGVYNLSNETEEISVGDLARTIASMSGNIEVTMLPADPSSATLYCSYKRKGLDCSRLNGLGWFPQVKLEDGLGRTLRASSPE